MQTFFFNVATRKWTTAPVAQTMYLWDNAGLDAPGLVGTRTRAFWPVFPTAAHLGRYNFYQAQGTKGFVCGLPRYGRTEQHWAELLHGGKGKTKGRKYPRFSVLVSLSLLTQSPPPPRPYPTRHPRQLTAAVTLRLRVLQPSGPSPPGTAKCL